jgi:ATP-binding cassette, subfamily F, member 3
MRAKDVLLEAIAAFSGTIIFVSHDRYFIDRLATRVLEVENGSVISYEGNYEDYLRKKEALAAAAAVTTSSASPKNVIQSDGTSSTTGNGLGHGLYQGTTLVVPNMDQKGKGALAPAETSPAAAPGNTIVIEGGYEPANVARTRRLNPIKQKQMQDRCVYLEEEIPRVEASIEHTEQQLGVYVSAAETQRLSALAENLRAQLAALTAEWEELTVQLEG